jgi:hypothetical protein
MCAAGHCHTLTVQAVIQDVPRCVLDSDETGIRVAPYDFSRIGEKGTGGVGEGVGLELDGDLGAGGLE